MTEMQVIALCLGIILGSLYFWLKDNYKITRTKNAYLNIIVLPFVISASIEFLPAWLHFPIALLGGMMWLGACVIVAEKEQA